MSRDVSAVRRQDRLKRHRLKRFKERQLQLRVKVSFRLFEQNDLPGGLFLRYALGEVFEQN